MVMKSNCMCISSADSPPKNRSCSSLLRLTSPSIMAEPLRRERKSRSCFMNRCGSTTYSGEPVASADCSKKGTPSTRKPSSPSCSQKPTVRMISSTTSGWSRLRSGWCL